MQFVGNSYEVPKTTNIFFTFTDIFKGIDIQDGEFNQNQFASVIVILNTKEINLENIQLNNNMSIILNQSLLISKSNTNLKFKNIISNNNFCIGQVIQIVYSSDINVENLVQEGNNAIGTVMFGYSNDIFIKSFLISNNTNQYDGGNLIIAYSNNIEARDLIINKNMALMGAGLYQVYCKDSFFYNSTFEENDTITLDIGQGSSMMGYSNNNTNIDDFQILNNKAGYVAGGFIFIFCNNTQIKNTYFSGNIALTASGLYIQQSINSTFTNLIGENNGQSQLGGFYASSNCDKIYFYDSYFKNNTATVAGGFSAQMSDGYTLFQNCTIEDNQSGLYGGGIYYYICQQIDIIDCKFRGNSLIGGVGIDVTSDYTDKVSIINCQFENFSGINTGSIYTLGINNLYINNCNFISNNYAKYDNQYTILILKNNNSVIQNSNLQNEQKQNNGGIYIFNCGDFLIQNTTLQNHSQFYQGGSLFVVGTKNLIIDSSKFIDNISEQEGGCFYGKEIDTIIIQQSLFEQCVSYKNGGGIYLLKIQDVYIGKLTNIQNNSANSKKYLSTGGGIYIKKVYNMVLNQTQITGNTAYSKGGGIFVKQIINLDISQCLFMSNQVYFKSSKEGLNKSIDNYYISYGGGLFYESSDYLNQKYFNVKLQNNIFLNNTASSGGAIAFLQENNSIISPSPMNNLTFQKNLADIAPCIRYLGDSNQILQLMVQMYKNEINTKNEDKNIANFITEENQNTIWEYQFNERKKNQQTYLIELCPTSTKLLKGGELLCQPCEQYELCQGGYYKPVTQKYIWENKTLTEEFYFCKNNPEACLEKSQCKLGYKGILCEQCELKKGFYKYMFKECLQCPQKTTAIIIVVLVLVGSISLIIILTIQNFDHINQRIVEKSISILWNLKIQKKYEFGIYIKILITHFQIVYCLDTPMTYTPQILQVTAQLISDPGFFISQYSTCFITELLDLDENLIRELQYYMVIGWNFLIFMSLSVFMVFYYNISKKQNSSYKFDGKQTQLILSAKIVYFYIFLPGFIKFSIISLNTLEIGNNLYSQLDYQFNILEAFYKNSIVLFSSLSLFINAIVIPLILGIIFYLKFLKCKFRLAKYQRLLYVIYSGYSYKIFEWEIVLIIMKVVIIVFTVLFQDHIIIQKSLQWLIIFAYQLIIWWKQPYYQQKLNRIVSFSLFLNIIQITFDLMNINNVDQVIFDNEVYPLIILYSNILLLLIVILRLFQDSFQKIILKYVLKSKNIDQQKSRKRAQIYWQFLRQSVSCFLKARQYPSLQKIRNETLFYNFEDQSLFVKLLNDNLDQINNSNINNSNYYLSGNEKQDTLSTIQSNAKKNRQYVSKISGTKSLKPQNKNKQNKQEIVKKSINIQKQSIQQKIKNSEEEIKQIKKRYNKAVQVQKNRINFKQSLQDMIIQPKTEKLIENQQFKNGLFRKFQSENINLQNLSFQKPDFVDILQIPSSSQRSHVNLKNKKPFTKSSTCFSNKDDSQYNSTKNLI